MSGWFFFDVYDIFFEEFLKFLQQNFTVCVIHVLFDCCCKITTTTTNLTILDYCGFFAQCFSLSVLKSVSIVFFFKELSPCTWQQHVKWHHISVETTNRIKYALLKYMDFYLLFYFSLEITVHATHSSILRKRKGGKMLSRETIAII